MIMLADSATLKFDNKKNGWKGVCIHQENNGNSITCLVQALGCQILHIRKHSIDPDTSLSTYFANKQQWDATDCNISSALKMAAMVLGYPSRGFPVDSIDTHSLRSGMANALSLEGYSD